MATHSSFLAWRIPWTDEPGGLQSIESKKSDMTAATGRTPMSSVFKLNSVTVYSLDVFLSQFELVHCSVSSSNCCFLTCVQVSQEAEKVVQYSHFFQNCPQFVEIHKVKGFGVVNEAEVDIFLDFPCFFYDPVNVGNLISDSSAFSKSSLYLWKSLVYALLKASLNGF